MSHLRETVNTIRSLLEGGSFTLLVVNGMTGKSSYEGTFSSAEEARENAASRAKQMKKFMAFELWTGTPDKPGKFVEYLLGRKKGDKINPKTNTWESLDEAEEAEYLELVKHASDQRVWFRITGTTKDGFKGQQVVHWTGDRKPKKAVQAFIRQIDLAQQSWKRVQKQDVPANVLARFDAN